MIFCGDLNVAHTELDLANPKPNRGKKGFTDEEREGFQNFVDAGFVDTFRIFTQGNGHYSWWSHFANSRARNVGWRIDYVLVSEALQEESEGSEDPRRRAGLGSLPGQHHARHLAQPCRFRSLTARSAALLYSPIWVNINPQRLDGVFNALCDPTRRAILARLTDADARVTDIAGDFPISLNSISKHIRMLERAGLRAPLDRRPRSRAVAQCRAAGGSRRRGSSITAASGKAAWPPSSAYVTAARKGNANECRHLRSASAAVVVRRTIAASAEDLFDAWLDPEALAHLDAARHHPAARWRRSSRAWAALRNHHAGDSPGPILHKGVYRVIDRPRRLVFTWDLAAHRRTAKRWSPWISCARDKRTEVIVTHEQLPESAMPSHRNGWTSGLEHLDEACQKGLLG